MPVKTGIQQEVITAANNTLRQCAEYKNHPLVQALAQFEERISKYDFTDLEFCAKLIKGNGKEFDKLNPEAIPAPLYRKLKALHLVVNKIIMKPLIIAAKDRLIAGGDFIQASNSHRVEEAMLNVAKQLHKRLIQSIKQSLVKIFPGGWETTAAIISPVLLLALSPKLPQSPSAINERLKTLRFFNQKIRTLSEDPEFLVMFEFLFKKLPKIKLLVSTVKKNKHQALIQHMNSMDKASCRLVADINFHLGISQCIEKTVSSIAKALRLAEFKKTASDQEQSPCKNKYQLQWLDLHYQRLQKDLCAPVVLNRRRKIHKSQVLINLIFALENNTEECLDAQLIAEAIIKTSKQFNRASPVKSKQTSPQEIAENFFNTSNMKLLKRYQTEVRNLLEEVTLSCAPCQQAPAAVMFKPICSGKRPQSPHSVSSAESEDYRSQPTAAETPSPGPRTAAA